MYSTCITVPYCYCTWSVVLRPLFIFCFDKWAQNNPVWGRLLKLPLFSSFWKTGLDTLFGLVWSRVLCACRPVFCSISLDMFGGMHRWLFVTMPVIDIVEVRFVTFVCTLMFETNNAIPSPNLNVFIIGRIMWPGFQMFRGLSFGISPGELSCI